MRVDYNTCDHCGKELKNQNGYIGIHFDTRVLRVVDICKDCLDELEEMIDKYLEPYSNCGLHLVEKK